MTKFVVEIQGRRRTVELPDGGVSQTVKVDGVEYPLQARFADGGSHLAVVLGNQPRQVVLSGSGETCRVLVGGVEVEAEVRDERTEALRRLAGNRAAGSTAAGEIRAPMPGLVVKVRVGVGEAVRRGQGVLVIEAMKMENEIVSPVDGVVKSISAVPGRAVNKNEVLAVVGGT